MTLPIATDDPVSSYCIRMEKNRRAKKITYITIPIISIIVFIILASLTLFFVITIHTAPEHECHVSDCTLETSAMRFPSGTAYGDTGNRLYVQLYFITPNSTSTFDVDVVYESNYDETIVGKACKVSETINPSSKSVFWGYRAMDVEVDKSVKIPCFYIDEMFSVSFSIIEPKFANTIEYVASILIIVLFVLVVFATAICISISKDIIDFKY